MGTGFYNRVIMRSGMFILFLFLASWFKSCQELKYYRSGKTGEAAIYEVTKVTDSDGAAAYRVAYDVHNENSNSNMKGTVLVSAATPEVPKVGERFSLEYVGNDDLSFTSRPKGTGSTGWVKLFFFFLALMVGYLIYMVIFIWRGEIAAKANKGRR